MNLKGLLICLFGAVVLLITGAQSAEAADWRCSGKFIDPITGPCWDCVFPLTIGGAALFRGVHHRADPSNPPSPICLCGTPIPRVGIETGYWEPARSMDITQKPFCFVTLGGISMPIPIGYGRKATYYQESGAKRTAYHIHYYVYPLLAWMNLLDDFACMESNSFDIAYITEFDPTWQDDELASIFNPEVFLFSNPIAVMACAADCVAATVGGLPIQQMFWCDGCEGSLFPMTGNLPGNYGPLPAAELAAGRFLFKMHRSFLAMGTRGAASVCAPIPEPEMDKLQYRLQEVYPVADKALYSCRALGQSTVPAEPGKVLPFVGEDLGYLVWRKRNCCVL